MRNLSENDMLIILIKLEAEIIQYKMLCHAKLLTGGCEVYVQDWDTVLSVIALTFEVSFHVI